jgi:hypothetical protein
MVNVLAIVSINKEILMGFIDRFLIMEIIGLGNVLMVKETEFQNYSIQMDN